MEQTGKPQDTPGPTVPVSIAVADMYRKASCIGYAENEDGSLYVSNGKYIQKISRQDFGSLVEQVNRRKNSSGDITVVKKDGLLDYVTKAQGNYELTRKPYETESYYCFADSEQYFAYDKNYVNVFDSDDSRLLIDYGIGEDIIGNCLVVKSGGNDVLGVILPVMINDETLARLEKEYPLEKDNPPALDGGSIFMRMKQSPWGEIGKCVKLCPGVFDVTAEKGGGIMVALDMTAALSTAALRYGERHSSYMCYEGKHAKDVVLRELLDKKLWEVPGSANEQAAFAEKLDNSLREHCPHYWRSRENGRQHALPAKTEKTHDER